MTDVKWIKFSTGFPNSRKLKQIRKLPNGDTIALFWVFLICLAGDINEDGMVYLTKEVPYTEEMLADEFDIDINTIRLGLQTFQRFGMIEIVDNIICLSSWEKWQNTDRLADIREKTKARVAKHREKQKLLPCNVTVTPCNVTSNVTVTQCNALEEDIDIEEDKEKKNKIKKHKYGEYNNVLLTDEELDKLKVEYPDYLERIERLSSYVASTGKSYKSHYATIRNWARKDAEKPKVQNVAKKNGFNAAPQRKYEMDSLERMLVE